MAATTKQRQQAAPAADPYLAAAQAAVDSSPETGKRGTYLRLPQGAKWTNFARGQCYRTLHLAFTWGKHPQQNFQTGQLGLVLRLQVHNQVGPQQITILCNQAMFGKKCAVCDEYSRRTAGRGRLPDEEFKALANLRVKHRSARLIHVLGDDPLAIQVFEEADSLYDDFLNAMVANRESFKRYAHPLQGSIIEITGREKPIGKGSCTEYATLVFTEFSKKAGLERMPQALVDKAKAIVFDDCLIMPPKYEVVAGMVKGFVGALKDSNGQAAEEVAETPEGNEIVEEPAEPTNEVVETSEPEPKPDEPEEIIEDIDEPVVEEPEPEPAIEVGSAVTFTYKGEAKEGEVKELDGEKAKIKVGKQIFTVKVDQLTPA